MAFIPAPDFRINGIEWGLLQPSQINVSIAGKRLVSSEPLYGKWMAHVSLAPRVGAESVRLLRSFFIRCGPVNTFNLSATDGPAQNANSGVTVSATAAAGAQSFSISGAATAMIVGQYVTVNNQLLLLTAVSGNSLTFVPALRAQAVMGTAVETAEPFALVRLASEPRWGIEPGPIYSISFDAEEAI